MKRLERGSRKLTVFLESCIVTTTSELPVALGLKVGPSALSSRISSCLLEKEIMQEVQEGRKQSNLSGKFREIVEKLNTHRISPRAANCFSAIWRSRRGSPSKSSRSFSP